MNLDDIVKEVLKEQKERHEEYLKDVKNDIVSDLNNYNWGYNKGIKHLIDRIKKQDERNEWMNNIIVYDDVSGYGITIRDNEIYIVVNGEVTKLDKLIIKEREEN